MTVVRGRGLLRLTVCTALAVFWVAPPASGQDEGLQSLLPVINDAAASVRSASGRMTVVRTAEASADVLAKATSRELNSLGVGHTRTDQYAWASEGQSFILTSYSQESSPNPAIGAYRETQNTLFNGTRFYNYLDFPEHPSALKVGSVSSVPIVIVTPLCFGRSYRCQSIPDALQKMHARIIDDRNSGVGRVVTLRGTDKLGRTVVMRLNSAHGYLAEKIATDVVSSPGYTIHEEFRVLSAEEMGGIWFPTRGEYVRASRGPRGPLITDRHVASFDRVKVNDPSIHVTGRLPVTLQLKNVQTDALTITDAAGVEVPLPNPQRVGLMNPWAVLFVISAGVLMLLGARMLAKRLGGR